MTGAPIDDILLNINPTGQLVLGAVLALIIYGVALDRDRGLHRSFRSPSRRFGLLPSDGQGHMANHGYLAKPRAATRSA